MLSGTMGKVSAVLGNIFVMVPGQGLECQMGDSFMSVLFYNLKEFSMASVVIAICSQSCS